MNVPPRDSLPHDDLERLERLARLLDNAFTVPGLGWRFGLDPILGLFPGLGDTLTSLVSLYILVSAARFRVPKALLMRMAANVAFDYLAGSVPVAGDVIDVAWKSNVKNVELLKGHVATSATQPTRSRRWTDWALLVGLLMGLAGLLTLSVLAAWTLWTFVWKGLGSIFS